MEHKNKFIKSLCIAAFLSILCLPQINSKAMAQAPVPTLDRLNQEGATIPDTDPPQVYPESAYTLTEIENADPENLPQNAITLYDKTEVIKYYDPQTGLEVAVDDRLPDVQYKKVTTIQTTPKYYLVNLKDSVTNIGEGDTTKYFEWSQNADGRLELKEVSAPTEGKTTITVGYDISSVKPVIKIPTADVSYAESGISGNFVGNSEKDAPIYNQGTVGNINGNFINNINTGTSIYGAAIHNLKTIGDINADFIGNQLNSSGGQARGGAIYTTGKIGNINGNFIGNGIIAETGSVIGGAIYNYSYERAEIGDITGNFIGNYAVSDDSYAEGGALNNRGYIGNIAGDFILNYAEGYSAYGGAIYNFSKREIQSLNGDFISNHVKAQYSAYGGAIAQDRTGEANESAHIFGINGNFHNNYAESSKSTAFGGAIYNANEGDISFINGDFIGNYAVSTGSYVNGGAIYNARGTIGDITGDFIGNYASSGEDNAYGGAIYNDNGATIGDITGDFIGNYASSTDSWATGGVIDNSGRIGNITGDFIGNYASASGSQAYAYGGAIYNNNGTIGDITGDFIGNYATGSSAYGGAIYNTYSGATIGNITGDFIGNYATGSSYASGGAIFNNRFLNNITGDFIGNYASSIDRYAYGGAIANNSSSTRIRNITGDFIGNYASSANSYTYGGAIYNVGTIGNIAGNFIGNYTKTKSDSQLALGGAVYTFRDMNFIADNQTNYFSGNYTEDYRGKINNAIFVQTSSSSSPTIKLQAQNNGVIIFDDQIDGGVSKNNSETGKYEIDRTNAYNLALDGDSTSKVVLNNDVINANISLDNTNLYLGREDVFDKSVSLSLNSGSIYLNNQSVGTMHIPTLNLNGNTNISVDADLANKSMDRITADIYNVKDNAMLNVNNVVLLSDAKEDVTNIQFADDELASNVAFTGASPIAYSPIWKYDVSYNPNDGFFTFSRGASASGGNASDAFNPSVLASPVATQAGAYTTQLQTFNYAFQHADTFMNIPYLERVAIINQNKYALSPTGDATDVGTYSPLLLKEESAGFWVKPYASFENVPLKNGPKVSNINYGTLVGYDSPLQSISNGFERVLTGYIGYNGASQRYSGVDAYQNGGLLGGTATFYKGNFFNATTLSVGASAGDASTMYGSENYTMLLAGLGNKTGYNFEFFDGGMILQPSMLISYTFVNTFDYNNAAGVRIESNPMHAIQLAPGIKLIGNTKNGWQPYIGVSMVWNLLDESKVTADSVRLPEMSIKPYVQYGVGIQKRVNDKFLAFGQAMIHNGGRNGVSLSAGLRWKIGRE